MLIKPTSNLVTKFEPTEPETLKITSNSQIRFWKISRTKFSHSDIWILFVPRDSCEREGVLKNSCPEDFQENSVSYRKRAIRPKYNLWTLRKTYSSTPKIVSQNTNEHTCDWLRYYFVNFFTLKRCLILRGDCQKQPPEKFYKKSCFLKYRKIHRKTPVPESLFW